MQDVPDSYIYRRLLVGVGDDPYYKGNIVNMLREVQEEGLFSQQQCQQYIGRSFRPKCAMQVNKLGYLNRRHDMISFPTRCVMCVHVQ